MSTPTKHLSEAGVSIWLDDLSRSRIITGNLADLIATRNVVGVTTNPTIFAGAIGSGAESYSGQIAQLAREGATADDAIFTITQGGPGTATTNLPYEIYQTIFSKYEYGEASAAGVVVVILTIIVATFALRVISGLFKMEEGR